MVPEATGSPDPSVLAVTPFNVLSAVVTTPRLVEGPSPGAALVCPAAIR